MTHIYQVEGMTCNGCREKIEATLVKVGGVTKAVVTLDPPEVVLHMRQHVALDTLNAALAYTGSYSLTAMSTESANKEPISFPDKSVETYKPLIIVVGFILLATIISQINLGTFDWKYAMRVFMGSFFIAFSFFKILDVKGFAYAYTSYDIVARRWLVWGYIYPVVELALGVAYLTGFQLTITYITTLLVMGVSTIGVVQSVLNKRQIKCACLGTGFNLPMSTVTIVEDVTMVVMAGIMLLEVT